MQSSTWEKRFLVGLMIAQASALLLVAWTTAPGWDEWGHLPSGLYSLQYGDYSPYCVNPPLTRLWCALPVWMLGGGIAYEALPDVWQLRPEVLLAATYIEQKREAVFYLMSVARTAAIPISLLGTYLIWMVGRRLFSPTSGMIAAGLWAFSPTVLTFGASITPDVTAAVFGLLAAWRCYIWLRLDSRRNAVWLGLGMALAMLSKASWLILPPVLILVSLVYAACYARRWKWRERLLQATIVGSVCWLVIHAGYEFRGTLVPLGHFRFVSKTLTGLQSDARGNGQPVENRFRGTWLQYVPAPLPADYIRGIDIQKRDFESKMRSYFLGQWRDHGWWYYYIVGIWLKEPLALWLLTGIGMVVWLASRFKSGSRHRFAARCIVLTPGLAILIFVSSQTGFNHHLRYVLPFLPCLYLLASAPLALLPRWGKYGVGVLLLWYATSSMAVLPRSFAYFTEAIGGPTEGWKYLGDSNLDWGQDLLTAKRWIDSNPEKRPVFLVYSIPFADFRKIGIDADDGRNLITADGPTRSGWWIVFERSLLEPENRWFREREPVERLSVTTRVYEVEPASVRGETGELQNNT